MHTAAVVDRDALCAALWHLDYFVVCAHAVLITGVDWQLRRLRWRAVYSWGLLNQVPAVFNLLVVSRR